jgi:hypothetical protein
VGDNGTQEWRYQLGGRLLMGELRRRSIMITCQVQEQQRALNLAETLIPRNVVTGGFLERIMLNAQMPGKMVEDATTESGFRFVPGAYETGPATTNWLKGVETVDPDGNRVVATPNVIFREPIKPDASIAASGAAYANILNEVDQAHHLLNADSAPAARSRVEARMDFLNNMRMTQAPLERLGRWLLETVLALAEAISNQPGKYSDQLRADFTCRVQVGQLTAEEQTALKDMVEAGLMSREDAMALLGVDDVDLAISKINSQPGSLLDMRKKQAEALAAWQDAGVSLEIAAELIGLSEEEVKKLKAMDPVPDPAKQGDPAQQQDPNLPATGSE